MKLHPSRLRLALVLWACCVGGCMSHRPGPVSKSLTQKDPKEATPEFWMAQPAVAAARCANFDKLWAGCTRQIRDAGYTLDRFDYRNGVQTTLPLISKQVFEVWRRDVGDAHGAAESTLSTMRRTLRFDITRRPDGTYEAVPRVLVERFAAAERRITSVVQYRDIFSIRRVQGDRTLDEGEALPSDYWFAEGRDLVMERQLARSLKRYCAEG